MPKNQAKSCRDDHREAELENGPASGIKNDLENFLENSLENGLKLDPKMKRESKTKPQKEQAKQWVVYIVECCDKTLYTGIAKDLERRLQEHNSGKGAKYTASRRPVKLLYSEPASGHGEALSREYAIKKLKRSEKHALVAL